LILNLVARSLAPVFLYGASIFGYTKAAAAELTRQQVKMGGKHQFRTRQRKLKFLDTEQYGIL